MGLNEGQINALKIAVSRFKEGQRCTVISGWAGTGKAQPVDTIIPTPLGQKQMGDLKIGDYVFNEYGEPVKIIGVYPQGQKQVYEVVLGDKRKTYCCKEHLWQVQTQKGNTKILTTQEILDSGLYSGKKDNTCKYKIPVCQTPVQYKEYLFRLPIDPYVFGVFLGDGCCLERQLTVSSSDEELVAEIAKLINAKSYKRNSLTNYSWHFLQNENGEEEYNRTKSVASQSYIQTNDFFGEYGEYIICASANKRIPDDYKYASVEDRYKLIQGLMDTDGSVTVNGNRYNIRFTNTSKQLIDDIREVLFSLGYVSSISEDNRKEKYRAGICYNISINIPNSEKYKLFKLKRKRSIAEEATNKKQHRNYDRVSISEINPLNEYKEMVCIKVDNPTELYLTNDFIVTHNTTTVRAIIEELGLNEAEVAYATYTGKAAQVLQKKGNQNSMTLHKLLYKSIPNEDGTFTHEPLDFLPYSLVVVDEVSMAPKEMMELLFSHEETQVICLGDEA